MKMEELVVAATTTTSFWVSMAEPPPPFVSACHCFPWFLTKTSQTLSRFSHVPSLVLPTTTASEVVEINIVFFYLIIVCIFLYSLTVIVITTESASKDTLEKVMSEALLKSGSNWSAVRAVCLGVSGVNHPTDQERILHWLRYEVVLFTIF